MLIITGANGTLGREAVQHVLDRVDDPAQVGVSVRDPQAAAPLAARGVRVRRGDFSDPASLRDAFEGVTQLLMISSNTRAGDTLAQHRAAIDAAVAAGARRIVYTSHMGAHPESAFPPARNHAATEQLLRDSGVAYTALRNGFYAVTAARFAAGALNDGALALPADGPVSWTTQSDLAEAAAIVLTDEGRFDGPTPPLTAADAHTLDDLAALLSQQTGREIARTALSDADYKANLLAGGMPEPFADFTLGMFAAMRAGDFTAVEPTLEQLLGRRPTTLAEVIATVTPQAA
ncbi:MAG TPA: SDR family oxidoreductase [Solirubrobacter sp.]|nr:SDR family oxidoreductase [Solirubrobacter sp.]